MNAKKSCNTGLNIMISKKEFLISIKTIFYASQPIQARILSLSVSIISKYINLNFFPYTIVESL